jgi:uncharacterized membrane protein YcjF (UPF0283 family)
MFVILIFIVALVAWSLHLMQEAFDRQESSLMLAGTLVAMAAAAMLAVYFLVGDCMVYLNRMAEYSANVSQYPDPLNSAIVTAQAEPWLTDYYKVVDTDVVNLPQWNP